MTRKLYNKDLTAAQAIRRICARTPDKVKPLRVAEQDLGARAQELGLGVYLRLMPTNKLRSKLFLFASTEDTPIGIHPEASWIEGTQRTLTLWANKTGGLYFIHKWSSEEGREYKGVWKSHKAYREETDRILQEITNQVYANHK